MTTNRRNDAEHPSYDPKARGPNGRRTCRRCLAEVPKGRSTFCGDACVSAFQIATGNAGWVRSKVHARDNGVCAGCGLRVDTLERVLDSIGRIVDRMPVWEAGQYVYRQTTNFDSAERRAAALAILDPDQMGWYRSLKIGTLIRACILVRYGWTPRQAMEQRALWEADHILPVAEGGGGCGLENYRTLCRGCHNKETAALAARRATKRREAVHGHQQSLFTATTKDQA